VSAHRQLVAAAVLAASLVDACAAPVTPSGDTVPENLLRIELHLARPLAHPLAMAHVRLLDRDGRAIPDAFLDLPLPAADGRTVALLLHPGRVKSGVGANVAMGRALHAGDVVTLVVDDPQVGRPLTHRWRVTAARSMQPAHWRVRAPHAGSMAPLTLTLDAAVSASGARLIALRGPDGERVEGHATLTAGEHAWLFRPAQAWRPGHYDVVVHPLLEDVAGDRACAPFEVAELSEQPCAVDAPGFDVRR